MVYKVFNRKSSGSGFRSQIMPNQELGMKLHKPIIRKFVKRKVYSSLKDNICVADLADLKLISKVNKESRLLLLCVTDVYSKYAWIVLLTDKKGIKVQFLCTSGT